MRFYIKLFLIIAFGFGASRLSTRYIEEIENTEFVVRLMIVSLTTTGNVDDAADKIQDEICMRRSARFEREHPECFLMRAAQPS